jgi:nucleoside-diphosphate-sugar epimerase
VAELTPVGEIGARTDWARALEQVDAIVHLGARVHDLDTGPHADERYQEINARGTQRLAAEAARNGVQRLVYLSSVKVNGEDSKDGAYSAADVPRPLDGYGCSKWQGEQYLTETAARTGIQAVVVRSPLVYGAGVRANFLRLLRWIDLERFLPLSGIDNRRSLVSVWNLCDLLTCVLAHPAAAGGTWMVSDGEDISTPELVRRIARAMGRSANLFPVPVALLRLAAGLLGKGEVMQRLCASLRVDITPTRERLGWSPPVSMDEALARTVRWYQSQRQP